MEIILHVGAHRTASTTLQRMMGRNGPVLNKAGVAYWGPARTRSNLFRGLMGPQDKVDDAQAHRVAERVRRKLTKEAALGHDTVLVSEENMIGTMREALRDACLMPEPGRRLERFTRCMTGHRQTVALGIRSYETWWTSVLAYLLTRNGPMPRHPLCRRLVEQPRRWRHVIADIAAVLPTARIRVWRHEAMARRPDWVAAQLLRRQLDLPGTDEHLNSRQDLAALRKHVADKGRNPEVVRAEGDQFMPFDETQRAVLRAHYAEDLAWLAAGAGGMAELLDEPGGTPAGPTGQARG